MAGVPLKYEKSIGETSQNQNPEDLHTLYDLSFPMDVDSELWQRIQVPKRSALEANDILWTCNEIS